MEGPESTVVCRRFKLWRNRPIDFEIAKSIRSDGYCGHCRGDVARIVCRRCRRALAPVVPFKGCYAVTNAAFVDPSQPGYLQVRIGGNGGVAQVSAVKVWPTVERMDLATANVTMEDSSGRKSGGKDTGKGKGKK